MCPLPLSNEGELGLVVRYSFDDDGDMCEAVVTVLQIAEELSTRSGSDP